MSLGMGQVNALIAEASKTKQSVEVLEQLIRDHDVIFLLTDTRESRWLPTLLAALHSKVCIFVFSRTGVYPISYECEKGYFGSLFIAHVVVPAFQIAICVALGFDTYVVMRHGFGVPQTEPPQGDRLISGDRLACYFCSDVVAPANVGNSFSFQRAVA